MNLRKATLGDIGAVRALINGYAAQGIMLPRTDLELAEHVRDFTLAFDEGGALLGCGALHIYTPTVAEVRSLAVEGQAKTKGVGRAVVEALMEEGRAFGLSGIFAFTYVPEFFLKLGFAEVDRGELPLKAWKDCLRCPKFQACDEIAVLARLRENTAMQNLQVFDPGIQIPVPKRL